MDKKFDEYIKNLVSQCLTAPGLASLPPDQTTQKLTDHFYNIIMDEVIDNLTDDQVREIQDLSFDDPRMKVKIEEFTSGMPDLLRQLDTKLNQEVEKIKSSGHIPQE